jgi:tetratricopeptide (TPR) repeat protein
MNSWGIRLAALGLALAAGMNGPAAAQAGGDARAKLERAGRLSEMADQSASSGDRGMAISLNRKALRLIDEALAAGADPGEIEQGRRMIQLDLGDWLLAEKKWNQALELFRDAASVRGEGFPAYVRVRALKGLIAAEAGLGNRDAARGVLAELVREGRDMLARDPKNSFLTRQLAEFLEVDTFVRYWADNDSADTRASAAETLALFRAVAAANPDSGEARRAVFVWAWVNAKLTNEVPLWKEALEQGLWLENRKELKGREAMLAEVKRKMEKYERTGTLNIGD